MSTLSQKLTTAALAGLFTASIVTAGAAFAGEEKTSCTGKDKAAAEKTSCKGEAKASCHGKDDANKCTGKDAEGKAHCAGKDAEAK